jgi:hypothetical protein
VLDAPAVRRLLSQGVPGVVVTDAGRAVGVLTVDRLLDDYRVRTETMGDDLDSYRDAQLHGDPPVPQPLALACGTCGAQNEVTFYVAGETACVNGHPLAVDWQA